MFGGGAKYITKSQVRHSTVIITDFNTQGKYVTDASQIQTGEKMTSEMKHMIALFL